MITFADARTERQLAAFTDSGSIYACKIACLLASYGTAYDFCRFWIQTNADGDITAAISKYGSDTAVCAADGCDINELAEFLDVMGYSSVFCPPCMQAVTDPLRTVGGTIMRFSGAALHTAVSAGADIVTAPDLRDVYALLKKCDGNGLDVPAYEDFLPDVSHRLRHHTALCHAVIYGGSIAAAALTAAQSERAAIIGAVAVAPGFRRKGFGTAVVQSLCCALGRRTVYIIREPHKNAEFYRKQGFISMEN